MRGRSGERAEPFWIKPLWTISSCSTPPPNNWSLSDAVTFCKSRLWTHGPFGGQLDPNCNNPWINLWDGWFDYPCNIDEETWTVEIPRVNKRESGGLGSVSLKAWLPGFIPSCLSRRAISVDFSSILQLLSNFKFFCFLKLLSVFTCIFKYCS